MKATDLGYVWNTGRGFVAPWVAPYALVYVCSTACGFLESQSPVSVHGMLFSLFLPGFCTPPTGI